MTMENQKAKPPVKFTVLPTIYKGITFRSRLEARWALFMDLIGVQWAYEPEGYLIDNVKYLPDFFLYRQKAFLEIKPAWPTEKEAHKCEQLALATGLSVFLQHGPLLVPDCQCDTDKEAIIYFRTSDGLPGYDQPYLWCECPECGHCELQFDGRSERCSCPCIQRKRYNYESPKLVRAYSLAAAERWFEG